MDGFSGNSGVIVLAATNRPDVLDSALLRPGRFDRQVTVDRPDVAGRVKILQVYPMYKAFIEPDLETAHIKIENKFNPFTGFENATFILKSLKSIPEDHIKAVLSEDLKESFEQTYDIYLLPPGEDPESCQSYLRMRNKEGKYNLMFEISSYANILFMALFISIVATSILEVQWGLTRNV